MFVHAIKSVKEVFGVKTYGRPVDAYIFDGLIGGGYLKEWPWIR